MPRNYAEILFFDTKYLNCLIGRTHNIGVPKKYRKESSKVCNSSKLTCRTTISEHSWKETAHAKFWKRQSYVGDVNILKLSITVSMQTLCCQDN